MLLVLVLHLLHEQNFIVRFIFKYLSDSLATDSRCLSNALLLDPDLQEPFEYRVFSGSYHHLRSSLSRSILLLSLNHLLLSIKEVFDAAFNSFVVQDLQIGNVFLDLAEVGKRKLVLADWVEFEVNVSQS